MDSIRVRGARPLNLCVNTARSLLRERPGAWLLVLSLLLVPALALAAQPTDAGNGFGQSAATVHESGDCTFCHLDGAATSGATMLQEPALCKQCHMWQGEHIIEVTPNLTNAALPLNASGQMTCITCHDHHGTEPLILRLTTSELCAACHDK